MKWLKFRETWAWGCSDWKYRPLYMARLAKKYKVEIEEEMYELANEHNWSDKFRGIEWHIISTKQVPNKHIEETCEGVKRSIHYYNRAAREAKESLLLIETLKGRGRKTCPDQIRHDKHEKRLEKLKAKRVRKG